MNVGLTDASFSSGKRRLVRGIVLLLVLTAGAVAALLLANGRAQGFLTFLRRFRYVPENPPVAFGSFHLIWLGTAIVLTTGSVFLGIRTAKTKGSAPRARDAVLFFGGLLLLLSEIWKQLYTCFVVSGGVYDFGAFPFQFCTLPMAAALIASLMPEGNPKRGLIAFLPLYGSIGGIAVLCYPALPEDLALACHSMFWHTALLMLGGYLMAVDAIGKQFVTEWLPGGVILTAGIVVSVLLNEALEPMTAHSPRPINLFYLSRRIPSHYIVIGDAQRAFGWWAGVLAYWLLFLTGAVLLWCAGALGLRIARSRAPKNTNS